MTTDAIALWKAVFWVLVHGTVLAAIAWAVSATLLRRARPAIVAALWSIVLLKFVVPVGPAMPWSVSSMIDGLFGGGAPAAKPAVVATTGVAPHAPAAASVSWLGLLALVATAAWLAVVAIILTRRVREHVELRRRAAALPAAPRETTALVAAVARRLGLRRAPEVRVTDGAVPWVLGARRPVLVLPRQLTERDDLAAVVGHELAHLRRRDAWLRLLQVGAGALLFFWPVVRLVNRRIDAARELACDAWAIERGPLAPHEYARVLVRLVRRAQAAPACDAWAIERGPLAPHEYARVLVRLVRRAQAAPAGALALAAHPHLLGRRVDALLAPRRRLRAGVGLPGVALLAGWGVLALGGASDAHANAAAAARRECRFDPQLAAEIMAAYPQADIDGDGQLTRAEACDFQLELGRLVAEAPVSEAADELVSSDALRLQCGSNGDTSASSSENLDPPDTCTQD